MRAYLKGITLLEVVIATSLGLILLASVFHVYLSSKRVYQKHIISSELQDGIRFVSSTLTQNIRMAGFAGCAKISNLKKMNHFTAHKPLPFDLDWDENIYGFTSSNAPNYLHGKIADNTDGIIIRKADIEAKQHSNDDILLISDCDYADLFKAQDRAKIINSYHRYNSLLNNFTEIIYFIGKSSRVDERNQPIYGLYSITNRGDKEELLANVNGMKINYGVNKRQYTAEKIGELNLWDAVETVSIDLIFSYKNTRFNKLHLFIKLRNN